MEKAVRANRKGGADAAAQLRNGTQELNTVLLLLLHLQCLDTDSLHAMLYATASMQHPTIFRLIVVLCLFDQIPLFAE